MASNFLKAGFDVNVVDFSLKPSAALLVLEARRCRRSAMPVVTRAGSLSWSRHLSRAARSFLGPMG